MIPKSSYFVDDPYVSATPVFIREDNSWLLIYNPPFFLDTNSTQQLHTVLPGETLQSIAVKYYGDSGKWYYIAERNQILNPFKEVTDGMLLIIPKA